MTYAEGPQLIFTNGLSKRQFAALCHSLAERFSSTGGTYRFEPERITEGGLEMIDFPGKRGDMLKTMRMHMYTKKGRFSGGEFIKWPWIEDDMDVLTEWTASPDTGILIPSGATADTTLKAFKGAPVWTVIELGLVRQVMANYGVRCKKMPSAKILSSPRGTCT